MRSFEVAGVGEELSRHKKPDLGNVSKGDEVVFERIKPPVHYDDGLPPEYSVDLDVLPASDLLSPSVTSSGDEHQTPGLARGLEEAPTFDLPVQDARDYLSEIADGKYKIIDRIGSGGMGSVFVAEQVTSVKYAGSEMTDRKSYDKEYNRKVAVKILRPDWLKDIPEEKCEAVKERFRREVLAQAQAGHKNAFIAPVFDFVELGDGAMGIVMDYFPAGDASTFVRCIEDRTGKQGVPEQVACEIVVPVLLALQEMHERGIIHRDLKLSNILPDFSGKEEYASFLNLYGGSDPTNIPEAAQQSFDAIIDTIIEKGGVHPYLTDFGIAAFKEHFGEDISLPDGYSSQELSDDTIFDSSEVGEAQVGADRLTFSDQVVGTATHMAPEMINKGKAISPQTDLYQMGLILYELLSGKLPFQSEHGLGYLLQNLNSQPRPLDLTRRENSETMLDRLVMTLLEKDPEMRKNFSWKGVSFDISSAAKVAQTISFFMLHRDEGFVSTAESSLFDVPLDYKSPTVAQYPYNYVADIPPLTQEMMAKGQDYVASKAGSDSSSFPPIKLGENSSGSHPPRLATMDSAPPSVKEIKSSGSRSLEITVDVPPQESDALHDKIKKTN